MNGSSGRDRGARHLAWEVLWRTYRDEAYPDLLLSSRMKHAGSLARADRALASELVFGTLRWQQSLDLALGRVCHRGLDQIHAKILIILRMGSYQILYLDRIPPSAAVNESVEMAKEVGFAGATSFINGVLREVTRKGHSLLAVDPRLPPAERISLETSHPRWMVELWLEQWGEADTRALCHANNEVPPLTLRTNTLKTPRTDLIRSLESEGVKCDPTHFSPEGLRVAGLPGPVNYLESFKRGEFQVQDEASQLMAYWLGASPCDLILDACAAPGGKTAHLGQLLGNSGKVVAADIHEGRLKLVEEECHRLGLTNVQTRLLDLSDHSAIPDGPYSRILLDAPCSGLGVLRRHPDAKWRRKPEDVGKMASLQMALLRALIPHLSRGGIILFGVCTHTREETEGVLQTVVHEEKGIRLLIGAGGLPPAAQTLVGKEGIFRSFPHLHKMDGFTGFRLQKM